MERGNGVPKSTMKMMKDLDETEIRQRKQLAREKALEALGTIDWGIMEKHLTTPERREAYERLCNQLRTDFLEEIPRLIDIRIPDPFLRLYYEQNPPKPSFKEAMLLKLAEGKLLIKRARPVLLAMGFIASFGVGFASAKFVYVKKTEEN